MQKNIPAIHKALSEPDSEFGMKHLMAQRVADMPLPKVFKSNGPRPDAEYFQYFLKITFDQRYWIDAPPWTAGFTYELPDGRVQIWTGNSFRNEGEWVVYEYESMNQTGDWLLD